MGVYPDGTLLKASGPEIDMITSGVRRWIPDPTTFTDMGLNWNNVVTISDSEWSTIPSGPPYPSWTDGTLLQGSGPQVYVMQSSQRHWIPDPATFTALGYQWSAIKHIADADLTAIPEGAAMAEAAAPAANPAFDQITQVPSAYLWQVQSLVTALAPAANADKSLNYQTAVSDAEHGGLALGMSYKGLTLASKTTASPETIGDLILDTLQEIMSAQPAEPGLAPWTFDSTLAGLATPALRAAFTNVAGSQSQPWFGWGATSATSTTYNYNLLCAYNPPDEPGGISVLILGLTVTVNLSQQQLLALTPTTSATYTITANAIPGLIQEKLQQAPPVPISSIPPSPFSLVAPSVSATYGWQVQNLVTALAPAANADKSLNYQTAVSDAEHGGLALGMSYKGLTLASKTTASPETIGDLILDTLQEIMSAQPAEPGLAPWTFDSTLAGLATPALRAAFTNVAGSQSQPWFGWGATSATSTTYNYNLLCAYNPPDEPGGISVLILGLTVTVNLSQQQLLALTPTTSATYTITANAIPGLIQEKVQTLS